MALAIPVRPSSHRRGASLGLSLRRCGFGRRPLHLRRIAPEHLELVEHPRLLAEEVDDHVHVVHQHPAADGVALLAEGPDALVAQPDADALGDGLELPVARPGAQDKEVGELRDGPKVEDQDVLRLQLVRELGARTGGLFGGQRLPPCSVASPHCA